MMLSLPTVALYTSVQLLSLVQQSQGQAYFDVTDNGDSYILNSLNDHHVEMQISSILQNEAQKYKDYPPIVSFPTKSQRTLEPGHIPPYVLDYSPLVYLYSEERYLPYDIGEFVTNFHVRYKNGTVVPGTQEGMDIGKLAALGDGGNSTKKMYLTSNSNFDADPDWITGVKNKPSLINGEIRDAPATLIVVDKGNGWVDAYWFYFYSFNLGPFVMGQGPYGNHVGDWEHSLVRFYKGEPVIVWMSAHGGGGAFYYHNLEKWHMDERHPIIFSAMGTHANYPSVGQHPHDLPYDILSDFTDRGPLWNPERNYLGYTFDGKNVWPATNNSNKNYIGREWAYGNWLRFKGHWGDRQLPEDDPRQKYTLIGGHKYIDGPTGPLRKNLMRIVPCERAKWWNFWRGCNVRQNIKWGVGVESEGYNCGNLFVKVQPGWVRSALNKITWGGGFCYIVDLLYG
ncbi:uncharacterized protein LODBEIA_P39910 [Lodderomyces beijingensis]|uniref:Vacuolar protein sorting-associated protein 62 n=1 Tax=Lodderomyces beijingensis TaxID=1775926 RepID=A0ABP0ZU17_9ASCO